MNKIFRKIIFQIAGDVLPIEWEWKLRRISQNAYYDKLTELVIQRALSRDSVSIDIGCFEGAVLKMMMQYSPEGEFWAFEPLPRYYEKLNQEFSSPRIHLYNVALSNKKGESFFNYVITNPGYSGLKKRQYDRSEEEDIEITVQTDLLDHIFSQHEVKKVSLIKIDVEGAELQVLRGAQNTIKTHKPIIIFEHGIGGSECYGTQPEEVYDFLCGECRMKISLLNSWLRNKKPFSKSQFCRQFYKRINYYFIAYP